MLNRFKINFDNVYYYAIKKPQLYHIEEAIINADEDVAEINLETIKKYSYIYCESNNTFASQVGRELSTSAKSYGMCGLKAASIGIGVLLIADNSNTPDFFVSASAVSLAVGVLGGMMIGGMVGGWHALEARYRSMLIKTPEEKERVAKLKYLAECRVAFFQQKVANRHKTSTVQKEEQLLVKCV